MPVVGRSIQICYADDKCEDLETNPPLSKIQENVSLEKQRHEKVAAFDKKYAGFLKDGTISELNGHYTIVNPSALSGKQIDQISGEISDLVILEQKEPMRGDYSPPKNDKEPRFSDLVKGGMGLLDCCRDVECKKSLVRAGLNLVPTEPSSAIKEKAPGT